MLQTRNSFATNPTLPAPNQARSSVLVHCQSANNTTKISRAPSSAAMSTHTNNLGEGSVARRLLTLAQRRRPDIRITLRRPSSAVYSTLDTVEGEVLVTTSQDLRFESIEIDFIGEPWAYVQCESAVIDEMRQVL